MNDEVSGDVAGFRTGVGVGSRIAGYRLEAQIGRGGMAEVFLARDERLGRMVALKVLAPALGMDQGFRQRFIRESRAAAAVDDPHIVPVYEAGEADGVLFIAMRSCRAAMPGRSCTARARCRPGARRRSSRRWRRRWMPRTPLVCCTVT
jgi:serine/threonine protein kinase